MPRWIGGGDLCADNSFTRKGSPPSSSSLSQSVLHVYCCGGHHFHSARIRLHFRTQFCSGRASLSRLVSPSRFSFLSRICMLASTQPSLQCGSGTFSGFPPRLRQRWDSHYHNTNPGPCCAHPVSLSHSCQTPQSSAIYNVQHRLRTSDPAETFWCRGSLIKPAVAPASAGRSSTSHPALRLHPMPC